jgi:hypothetical protein
MCLGLTLVTLDSRVMCLSLQIGEVDGIRLNQSLGYSHNIAYQTLKQVRTHAFSNDYSQNFRVVCSRRQGII